MMWKWVCFVGGSWGVWLVRDDGWGVLGGWCRSRDSAGGKVGQGRRGKAYVRNNLRGARTIVLDYVIVHFGVGDVWHRSADDRSGNQGEDSADLDLRVKD